MIIYKGDAAMEDLLLNISGFLAFVVALVPTPLKALLINPVTKSPISNEPPCQRSNVPSELQFTGALTNNLFALLVAFSAVLAVVWFFRALAARQSAQPSVQRVLYGTAATAILAVGVLVLWVLYLAAPDFLRSKAHLLAAFGMFAGIVAVVGLNWRAASGPYRAWYRSTFLAMATVAVVGLGLAVLEVFQHTIFWVEAALIALFAVFWVVQTVELWQRRTRGSKDPGPTGPATTQ
ncbi:hypothetical protein [Nocardioides marmoraquaticus]